MSYGSQFRGRRRVAQLFGQTMPYGMPVNVRGARQVPLTVSAAYQTVLNVSGRGALNLVAVRCSFTDGLTGLRITVDGRQIFTFSSGLSANSAICAIGSIDGDGSATNGGFAPQPIQFVSSALVEAFFNTGGGGAPTVFLNYEVDV